MVNHRSDDPNFVSNSSPFPCVPCVPCIPWFTIFLFGPDAMKPETYPVQPASLYAGEYPGSPDPEAAKMRIRHLVEGGVRTFIDLTTPVDELESYQPALDAVAAKTGHSLRRLSFPVPDMSIPASPEEMEGILAAIRAHLVDGSVYVHCWGGIGRTGTVIGCWLRGTGLSGEEALARVQHLYSTHMPKSSRIPKAPQTAPQRDFVKNWQGALPSGGE